MEACSKNIYAIKNLYPTTQTIINTNAREYLLDENSVDFIVTSPPYFNNIRYSTKVEDLSNFSSLNEYLTNMRLTFLNIQKFLKKDRFLSIIIGDSQKGKKLIPIHSLLSQQLNSINFELTHIWINHFPIGTKRKEGKRSIGYPNYMYVEFDHEYILLFKNNK